MQESFAPKGDQTYGPEIKNIINKGQLPWPRMLPPASCTTINLSLVLHLLPKENLMCEKLNLFIWDTRNRAPSLKPGDRDSALAPFLFVWAVILLSTITRLCPLPLYAPILWRSAPHQLPSLFYNARERPFSPWKSKWKLAGSFISLGKFGNCWAGAAEELILISPSQQNTGRVPLQMEIRL